MTVWLIRALLICTALISRLSLLQSASERVCVSVQECMLLCVFVHFELIQCHLVW